MTDQLSPAAQAVRRAAASAYWAEEYEIASPDVIAAAALRAAVEKCAGLPDGRDCTELLRNIATELENTDA